MIWVALVCAVVLYKVLRFFFGDDDDVMDVGTSDFNALFTVAARLEKLYGGKAFVGLRIPDVDSGTPQNIDLVLVTKREAVVICVKNLAGFVSVNHDGSWICISERKEKEEHHENPVAEAKRQAAVLEAYLEQRGVALPEGYFSYKVIASNPKFRALNPDAFPPEVIQYDQWVQMKAESKGMFSGWIKGALNAAKKEMQEPVYHQLQSVLTTSPMWDRLELGGSKYVLGEFLEFKGKHDDLEVLQYIKRSKVDRVVVQKTSMFGLAPTKLQVLYSFRDFRNEGASGSEWTEVTVRSSTEIVFQPHNAKKVRKFKFHKATSLTLSA